MIEDRSSRTLTFLLYAQDSKGMGHINRTLTIARHLLAAYPNAVAYVATESPALRDFTPPERCDFIKLPRRLVPNGIHETEAEVREGKGHFRDIRAKILREAALGLAPDLVLVDHEPLGYRREFGEGLFALKAKCPDTKFVLGLRDIMDDVGRIRAKWKRLGVYEAFENLYDGIAVYGSREVYDVAEAYAIPPSAQAKLHYCGYVVREQAAVDASSTRQRYHLPMDGPLVVATVGSGADGFPVLATTQTAIRDLQTKVPGLSAVLVTGPFMPTKYQTWLESHATPTIRVVHRADNFRLMGCADAIVSMGGYNSVCEALAVERPLVIVPRVTHKVEQRIRAERLAAHGLVRYVLPKQLNGKNLSQALLWALNRDRDTHARLVRELIPSFEGAARLTSYVGQWLGNGRSQSGPSPIDRSTVEQPA